MLCVIESVCIYFVCESHRFVVREELAMRIYSFDHDPWNNPSDDEEDLYSDDEVMAVAPLQENFQPTQEERPRLFSVAQVNPSENKVVIRNVTDEVLSMEGWYARDRETGKTSAPWHDVKVNPGGFVTLWTAPAQRGSLAPETEDELNIFWRNKTNGKPRRQPVFRTGSVNAGIDLVNQDGEIVDIGHSDPNKKSHLRGVLNVSIRRPSTGQRADSDTIAEEE